MPVLRRPAKRKVLWLSFLVSLLLHLGVGFWLGEIWRQVEDVEAFRAHLAYHPRFKPRRLISISAPDLSRAKSKMEYLATEVVPAEVQESGLESAQPHIPSIEAQQAPTELKEFRLGIKSDAPVLALEKMISPTQLGLADSVGSESMELLRLEDMARANKERATVVPDLASRQDLAGYINFTRLRLYGAGSDTAGSLDALARYVRDYTQILARVQDKPYIYFVSEQLLKDPIHFIIQGGGLKVRRDNTLTRLSEEEYALLERYLRSGGFLFIEGENRFLGEMIDHLQSMLGSEGGVFEIPVSHPIYHSYYSFEGGFPGENKQGVVELEKTSWHYPTHNPREALLAQRTEDVDLPTVPDNDVAMPDYLGLWGVQLNGKLVGVISDLQLHSRWLGASPFEEDEGDIDDSLPSLMAATNILVYTLIRPDGLTSKRERPVWVEERPDVPPQAVLPGWVGEDFDDGELFTELDSYLALVQSPLGSKIEKGDLRLSLDGRYSLNVLKRDLHGLLLHNLPAGKHWLELYYGGKSKHLEVDLQGGAVLTITFTLNRLAFFSQLRMHQQEELVGVDEWLQSFADMQIEEIYLDEEREVLESAAEY